MTTEGKIDVTDVPLDKLVRTAYALSRPQGLGFIHAKDGGLDDETLQAILKRGEGDQWCAVSMDYVHGRAVKFNVRRIDDRLYIDNQWFDHSTGQLKQLLDEVGLSPDLVDKARAEQAAYREHAKDAALAYIRERGGSIKQNRGYRHLVKPEEKLPAEVDDGLRYALTDKLVTEKYGDDGYTTWKLV
jgi:hypothetical protein